MRIMFPKIRSLVSLCRVFHASSARSIRITWLKSSFYDAFETRPISTVRGQYNTLSSKDIDYFKSIIDPTRMLQHPDELEGYNTDWLKSHKGQSKLVLRPKTTEEVSQILAYCNENNLAICPQGGNTGLSCGSIPIFDEIVISMSLMNKVLDFDEASGILCCQAGCVLEVLENYVHERNYVMPLDLGAKGSCQIGGNVSTNAGGLRLIRYGSLHGSVLGLKVVLASGEILNCMNTMRKNNTGYDLKHLFIGSEGTLGIVTEVAILCPPRTPEVALAFLGCDSFEKVLHTAKVVRETLPEVLSSLEVLDDQAADAVRENLNLTVPISRHPFYVLIEISGSNAIHNEEKLNGCLSVLMEETIVGDGTIATEPSHMKVIWAIRERISEALLKDGYCYKYDISLPISNFYEIVEVMRSRLGESVTRCVAYGHLGDGNLHFNATSHKFDPEILSTIEPFIYEWTSVRNGSISAEHGIGHKKREFLHLCKSEQSILLMRSIKDLLDPKGVLNPYKVFPSCC